MKKIILSLCLVGLACGGAWAKEPQREERTLTVQGQGKVSAVPNVATISVEVSQEGSELDPVLTQVRKDMGRVLDAVKKLEIAEKDIRTDHFQVNPKLEYDKRGNPKRVGYGVSNRVTVKIRDLKKTGKVLTAVLGAGATTVQGPQFEIDNPQEVERQALAAAVSDGRLKAQTLAEAAGVKLGEILSLNPQQVAWPMPGRPRYAMKALMVDSAAAEEPISAGEQTLTGYVTIIFALQ